MPEYLNGVRYDTHNEYRNAWRKANPEKVREQEKRYREKHHDKYLEQQRRTYQKNKEKRLAYAKQKRVENRTDISLKKRESSYGLSPERFRNLYECQGAMCAVCGRFFGGFSDANVDHNHRTGKIRGLLCENCNLAVGHVKDDFRLARKLAIYLARNSTEDYLWPE